MSHDEELRSPLPSANAAVSEEVEQLELAQQEQEYGTGRLYHHDPDDYNFLMAAVAEVDEEAAPLPSFRYYTLNAFLNQYKTSQCVGFSWSHWLLSTPIPQQTPGPERIYCEAQKFDPWDGDCENRKYDGSSVRAGAKVLQDMGYIDTYVWAFEADTIRRWILSGKGPVVVGTRWYQGMFTPDAQGFIRLKPNDTPAGGHAYLLIGASDARQAFRIHNSWGKEWGQGGRAWISYSDMNQLLLMQGEACTATEKVFTQSLVQPVEA